MDDSLPMVHYGAMKAQPRFNGSTARLSSQGLFILNQGIHWSIVGVIFPVLSLAIIAKGMNYFQLGILMAVYSGATVVLELPTGGLADSLGRKTVYLSALCCMVAGAGTFYAAQSFTGIAIAFLLLGTGRALASGTMDAHFIDALYAENPEVDLQRVMAKVHAAVPISLGLVSLLGGYLPDLSEGMDVPWLLRDPYSLNVLVMLLLIVIQMLLTLALIHESRPRPGLQQLSEGFKAVPRIIVSALELGIKNKAILLLLIGGFLWGFSISGLEQFWQPRVQEIGSDELHSRVFGFLAAGYFVAAAAGSLVSGLVGRLTRGNYTLMLVLIRAAMAAGLVLLALSRGLPGFSVFYIGTFFFNGMANSPESAVLNREVTSDRRSTVLSVASLIMQFGGLCGAFILGFLARTYSIPLVWMVSGAALFISALVYLGLPSARRKV